MGSQRVGHDWATELNWLIRNFVLYFPVQFGSVTQSCPTLCDPHGLQHTRLPCPSPSPVACSNSHPLSQWCHPTILSSVVPFSSCILSFPASGSFPMSQLFKSGDQSIGALVSASVLMNIQDWFPLGLTGLMGFWSFITQICPGPPLLSFKKNHRFESKLILRTWQKPRVCSWGGSELTETPPHRQGLQEREQGTMCVSVQFSLPLFPPFPHLFSMKWWDQMPWS